MRACPRGGVLARGKDAGNVNDGSPDTACEVGAVLLVELCAYCEYEPPSEPADNVERGDDALADLEGRECNNDVSVAAAFISTSSSTKSSEPSVLCGVRRVLADARGVCFRLPFSSLRAFVFAWALRGARLPFPAAALRGGVPFCGGSDFCGGTDGGSCGLCIVRARFDGGGCSSEAYRLCVAEAVSGGGAIAPFRDDLDDVPTALFPCVAGLL